MEGKALRTHKKVKEPNWALIGGQTRFFASTPEQAEMLGHLFRPDGITPDQLRTTCALTPEQQLLFAVLEEAIVCITKCGYPYGRQRARLRDEALAWMLSSDDSWLYSFRSICDHLGLEASSIQRWARQEWENFRPRVRRSAAPLPSSRYMGVTWHPKKQKWIAHIGRHNQFLALCDTEEEAARVRDAAAWSRWRKRARLNFPPQSEQRAA